MLKSAIAVIVFVGIVAAIWQFSKKYDDYALGDPITLGTPWILPHGNSHRLYYITSEERTYRYVISVGGRRSSTIYEMVPYTRYRLEARSAPSGDLARRTIVDNQPHFEALDGVKIIGVVPEGVWLWDRGLQLRDAETLEPRLTHKQIQEKNPEYADVLPDDVKDTRVSAPHGALVVKSADLRYLAIDPATGRITPADEEKLKVTPSKSLAEGFTHLPSAGVSRGWLSVTDFQVSDFITSSAEALRWYALLSEDERGRVSRWPTRSLRPYGEQWRRLYAVNGKIDDRGKFEIVPDELEPVGSARLLNAGFLQRTERAVWDLKTTPVSTLVLHKPNLKADASWQIAALNRTGKIVWDSDLLLTKLQTVNDADDTVIFFGTPKSAKPGQDGEFVFVDTQTGSARKAAPAPFTKADSPPFPRSQRRRPPRH